MAHIPLYSFSLPNTSYWGQTHHQASIPQMHRHAQIPSWWNQHNMRPWQNHANIPETHREYVHVPPEVRDMVYSLLPENYWNHSPVLIIYAYERPPRSSNEDQVGETELGMHNVTRATGTPTAEHVFNSLPFVTVPSHNEADECAICMDNMRGEEEDEEDEEVTQLPCGHMFHRACVGLWLCNHNTCPLCRFKLPAET